MVSCEASQSEHGRAQKKSKVDSPVVSQVTYSTASVTDDYARKQRSTQRRDGRGSLTPPPTSQSKRNPSVTEDDEDDNNVHTAEDVSTDATVASSKCHSHEHEEEEEDSDEHDVQPRGAPLGAAPSLPTRLSEPNWRVAPRLSAKTGTTAAATITTTTTTTTTALATAPLPVSTNGAITTLRSLSQLALLVSSANTSSAREKTHPDLRLKAGESVMLLLYFDEASLRPLLNTATSELSQMRVFTLNLAKLPPQDYEAGAVKRVSTGGAVFQVSAASAAAAAGGASSGGGSAERALGGRLGELPLNAEAMSSNVRCGGVAVPAEEEDEEEEEELVPAVHPMAVVTAAAEATASAERERGPRFSAGTGTGASLSLDEAASVSSLSGDLLHASSVVSEKLRQLLSVDTILNPHASQSHVVNSSSGSGSIDSKREPLLFPAMIVWRAAGAPREEYPPAPPQTYSSQPSSTPAEFFCDRMSVHGGPLVVKEATSIDQVHSLTLFRPVYTMENLFRTLVRSVAPSYATKAPGDKSRTVLYLGASWCPPCMRFVHDMPHFIRDDLPASVVCTLKADMDLAKPIYDYFKVEIIPTFLVLDNEVLMKCYDTLQQRGVAGSAGGAAAASQSEYLRGIQEAFAKAELARLQNSNRQIVSTFVSKHSQKLSFDEDF